MRFMHNYEEYYDDEINIGVVSNYWNSWAIKEDNLIVVM
jgi:hypothetical protein